MPPRIPLPTRPTLTFSLTSLITVRTYAATSYSPIIPSSPVTDHAPTQPPSHRAPDARKTQLHRTYLSILRSTPLMLVFQHNNLRAVEWSALRREVAMALNKIMPAGENDPIANLTKVTIVRGAVFSTAMRVAEFYDPNGGKQHGTSKEAYEMTKKRKKHPLAPLLSGPVGIVTFPTVSPPHLKAVVDIMFPEGRAMKGLDPLAVVGLQKLVLLAARVDGHVASGDLGSGRVLEESLVRWVAALPGFEALRGQLVGMLQSVGGADLVRSLEAIPISAVRTIDAHRKVLSGELEGEKPEGETPVEA
ncbi:hypothetical protein BDD12DRAFT_823735 [Trichophaea hybrida]|nr:hypothetical protein BDD12DRAFT_823735 [Trichophaea hybrida]